MLGAADPLPFRPRRVTVAGVSGVGKTTYAAEIGRRLGVPHTEIDSLFHGPDWTAREEFIDDVSALIAGDAWVIEWQYADVRPAVAGRAQVAVWLDLPYRIALVRVVRRTLRRRIRREVLWNGNREGPLWRFFTDPEHIVRWSIHTRNKYAERIPALEVAHPDLVVVRLQSSREASEWLDRLSET